MTQKKTVTMPYTDEIGISYEMTIVRHFTLGDKQFVLAVEKEHHHHEGEVCACHDHHHNHGDDDAAQEKAIYVFEWIRGSEGAQLLPVSDETLQALEPILEAM